ncbi:hypothetical protein J7L48_07365 [bacterium]|nr:hypothetical protein [bacterium]
MKKYFIIIFLSFLLLSYAGDLSFGGNVGMEQIGGTLYYSLALTPELRFGKLGMGFDFYLRWSDDGLYPYTSKDILSMIRYVQWADKGDKPIFMRFGVLDDSLMGHGFLLNHYQNATSYTIEKGFSRLGAQLDIDFKYFGFESITNDVTSFKVRGGRAYIRPLKPFIKKGPISGLTFGFSYLEDTDPYEVQRSVIKDRRGETDQLTRYEQYINIYANNGVAIDDNIKKELFDISLMSDEAARWSAFKYYSLMGETTGNTFVKQYLDSNLFDETNDPDKKLIGYSADAEMPLLGNFIVLIGDMAKIQGWAVSNSFAGKITTDPGYLAGFKGRLNLGFMKLLYQVDYRNIPENFIPAIFNSQYEYFKPVLLQEISDPQRISGYFGDINILVLGDMIRANITYEDYIDTPYTDIYPRIKAEAELNSNLVKNIIGYGVGAKFTVEKLDANSLDLSEPKNTSIKGNVTVDISKNTQIIYEYLRAWDSFGGEVKQVKLYSQLKF